MGEPDHRGKANRPDQKMNGKSRPIRQIHTKEGLAEPDDEIGRPQLQTENQRRDKPGIGFKTQLADQSGQQKVAIGGEDYEMASALRDEIDKREKKS